MKTERSSRHPEKENGSTTRPRRPVGEGPVHPGDLAVGEAGAPENRLSTTVTSDRLQSVEEAVVEDAGSEDGLLEAVLLEPAPTETHVVDHDPVGHQAGERLAVVVALFEHGR